MSSAGSSAEPTLSRREQRAPEKAEWAEHDALIKRLGQLWPNYGCFCGTLDDLRRTVADLERRAERTPPERTDARTQASASLDGGPQLAARLAVARAQQRLESAYGCGEGADGAAPRAELGRLHIDGAGEVDD